MRIAAGGFLVLKWRTLAFFHVPCATWGALIEFTGWVCPLTPLEVYLRELGGTAGYQGGFLDHYLLSLIYPHDLTRRAQVLIGVAVLVINLVAYGLVLARTRKHRFGQPHRGDP